MRANRCTQGDVQTQKVTGRQVLAGALAVTSPGPPHPANEANLSRAGGQSFASALTCNPHPTTLQMRET
jgi:hypothetical protein